MQSALGQQLRAQLELTGNDAAEIDQSCFKAKVESPDGYAIAPVNVTLVQKGGARFLTLVTRSTIAEPAVKILVNMGCEIQLHREFLILLDPPLSAPTLTAPTVSSARGTASPAPASIGKDIAGKDIATSDQTLQVKIRPRARKDKPASELTEIVATPGNAPATKKKPAKSTDKSISKPIDTLKLSDDLPVLEQTQGLRLSDSLSIGTPQSNIEELRAAQAQLAAMLRDEKPAQPAVDKLKDEQQKILSLQQEAQQLKRQSQLDKAALEEARENSFSRNWVMGLSVFIAAGLAIIALLLLYVSRMRKRLHETWWQQKEPASEPESKKNIEEIVDSIQASYGPTTTSSLYQVHDDDEPGSSRPVTKPSRKVAADSSLGKLDTPSIFSKAYVPTLEDSNSSTFNFFSTKGQSVKVEEISDVTQEAEFWISVNDPQRAIEILEPLADVDHPESPVPWLYLIDLYRVTANKEKYETLRDKFIVFFNANVPEFEVDPATLPSRHLDDFEHLMNRICTMWNSNDILPFLESLLVDDRDGKRMGFELPVYRDILLLISVANELEKSNSFGAPERNRAWANVPGLPPDEPFSQEQQAEPESNVIDFELIDFPKEK
ncbi:type IV pilus assembly protein FimV [Undibacterium sp. TC9W]|uniref:type IV pilus assembly protein FimV n=1 Tax=Undibacterium sp. TC9W TaxID=3413053 RepID=UPI003BF28F6A